MAFYGYCGPTSILWVLKKTARELRQRILEKENPTSPRHRTGLRGASRGNQKGRIKRETLNGFARRNKIYKLLFHIPGVGELGDILKTSEKLGTQPEDMVRYLRRIGFGVRVKEEACWLDLKKAIGKGKMVLVDWWTDIGDPGEDLGHYSVVIRVGSRSLTIFDPDLNKKRVLGKDKFLERWHDVRADGRKMLNWMAEIKY